MRLFEIQESKDWWKKNKYDIMTKRLWTMPGIKCFKCRRTWTNTGIAYPSIDISGKTFEKTFLERSPVNIEEFDNRKRLIKNNFGLNLFLKPGTKFGALQGKSSGKLGDFVFPKPWIMCIREVLFFDLKDGNLHLPKAVPADIKHRNKQNDIYLELQIEPTVKIVLNINTNDSANYCKVCGWTKIERPDKIRIIRKTVPSGCDIFRGKDLTTHIFCNEKFKSIVDVSNYTNIIFKEVEVV